MLARGLRRRVSLLRNSNQARGLAEFALDFLKSAKPSPQVVDRLKLFHVDSVLCGVSALALNTNAPRVLRKEALDYQVLEGAKCFGSHATVRPEKAVLANCAAVREWDANGTVFGFSPLHPSRRAGEFGHNDFYPVAMAAAQLRNLSGYDAMVGMLLVDEIRGRLAEVFSLKTYKIDHVLHGAIASAATYGAMMGASAEQIERAIGTVVAHYIPFRAIRSGRQLSDSKGSAAAFAAESAVVSVQRCMNGFLGPLDIFRNPESVFRVNQPTAGDSPFDLELSNEGQDFAVMSMHFKLGLYEHQSASAILGIVKFLLDTNGSTALEDISCIDISTYKVAHHIIGDPAKLNPSTRQSADHSMVFIISRLLRKAFSSPTPLDYSSVETLWKDLMLAPIDYSDEAILDPATRDIMRKVRFHYGGKDFDDKYPQGLPTRVQVTYRGKQFDSGLLLHPPGHSQCTEYDWSDILSRKFRLLGDLAVNNPEDFIAELQRLDELPPEELQDLYTCTLKGRSRVAPC